MKPFSILLVAPFILMVAACDYGPKSGRGFTLPEGDAAAGKQVFESRQCADCHLITGPDAVARPDEPIMTIGLGGEVSQISTYGELVTSVINPSHRISRRFPAAMVEEEGVSKMRNYNDVLTVSELIDLVAFLQSQYSLKPYEPTPYGMYH